jgi:hypothetical protein
MRNNTHARDRMMSRLTESERSEVKATVAAVREAGLITPTEDLAIYAARLSRSRAAECGSNGQNVVVMVRRGKVATVMLRRDNQPPTRSALRVDRVLRMNGGV